MKSIKKLLFVMAALAAVFGFVACSNDDDGGPSRVAVYTADESEGDYTDIYTLTFYDDDTFSMYHEMEYRGEEWSATIFEGTYRGNPEGNGDIYITLEKMLDEEGEEFVDPPKNLQDPIKITVKGGKVRVPVTTSLLYTPEFTRE